MALEMRQQMKLTQQLVMTPQLQQAIKLLQLSRLELQDLVRQELEENPILYEAVEQENIKDLEQVEIQEQTLKTISEEAITKHPNHPRKALTAYIRAPFELGQNDKGFRAVWSCYYHLATVNKAFAEFNRGVRIHNDKRLAALLTSIAVEENRSERSNRKRIRATATCIQGIMTGFAYIAAAESGGDYKGLGDLAVKAAQQIVDVNFPVNA